MLPKNEKFSKNSQIFFCECCDYKSFRKSDYKKHLASKKHKEKSCLPLPNSCQKVAKFSKAKYSCPFCDKSYNQRSGLWRHKKNCNLIENNNTDLIEIEDKKKMLELKEDNKELTKAYYIL